MELAVAGVDFRSAPLEFRERFFFRTEDVPGALERFSGKLPGAELVLLSTCNRTELYVSAPGVGEETRPLVELLAGDRGGDPARHFYAKAGAEAAGHLMAVASGLDSMVVGETEVLGQVKRAYLAATEARRTGRVMNALFHRAFRAAKRVHAETDIGRGHVSVSSVAVDFAGKIFEDLSSKTVLVVGAGETGELTLKSLVGRGVKEVLVLNRSFEKGRVLAGRCGGKAVPFGSLEDGLAKADIVISSTDAPQCVIPAAAVERAIRGRRGRPLLLLDIAVPRDIDEAAGGLEGVHLYNIDDLRRVAEENLAKRRVAVGAATRILRGELEDCVSGFRTLALGPLMKRIDDMARGIQEAELERVLARDELAGLPEKGREEVRAALRRTVRKMLAPTRKALNEAAKNGNWEEVARIAARLFGIERRPDDEDG